MPCRSDHMEPTAQEAYNQRTAQVMVTAALYFPEAKHFHDKAVVAANDSTTGIDYTAEVCAVLKKHSAEPSGSLSWHKMLAKSATDRGVRRLLDWWEDHKAGEERRAKEDTTAKIKAKAKEIDTALDLFAMKLADLADATDLTPDGRDLGDLLSTAAQFVTRARTTLCKIAE